MNANSFFGQLLFDGERGPSHIFPGAKDFNCHVEEKDTAVNHVSLVLLLHHRSCNIATGESEIHIDWWKVQLCTLYTRRHGFYLFRMSYYGWENVLGGAKNAARKSLGQGNKVIQDKDTFSAGGEGEVTVAQQTI